jgi:competence protein ComEC
MPGLVIPCTAALLLGIGLSGTWPEAMGLARLLTAATAAVLVAAALTQRRLLAAGALVALCVPAGWWLGIHDHQVATRRPLRAGLQANLSAGRGGEPVLVEGRLREDASPSDEGASFVLDVRRACPGNSWQDVAGGARLSVRGSVPGDVIARWRRGRCVRVPALLRVPTVFRDPGVSDGDLQLARRGIELVGSIKSAALIEECGAASAILERAGDARDAIRRAIARHVGPHSPQTAAVVAAVLIGDRAAMDHEISERLRRAGTFHVIAISGGNIAILTGLLLWVLTGAGAPPRAVAALTMLALGAYEVVVVRGASVDRAVLVAMGYLAARFIDLHAHPLALLSTAAGALAIADPAVAFDVGFALTFGATAGLVVVTPPLGGIWRGLAPSHRTAARAWTALTPLAMLTIATVGAETAVLPISAAAFGQVTFAGVLLNVVALPLMSVAQVAGIAMVFADAWWTPAARVCGWTAHLAVQGLLDGARLVDLLPWLVRVVPPPAPGLLVVYGSAVVAALLPGWPRRWRLGAIALACTSLLAICEGWWPLRAAPFAPAFRDEHETEWLRVTMLDVAQGDAVVVQFPGGRTMLVDTGGLAGAPGFDIGRRVVSPALHALGVQRLDWLVLTHGDPDHAGGALAILEDWRPREIWEGVPVNAHQPLAAIVAAATRLGIPKRQARDTDVLDVDGVRVTVWHPPAPDWERQRVRNDDSITIELRLGDVSVVLPGDIGGVVEARLAERWRPAPFCVLKAAHHGSAGSSAREWLRALRPRAVVYSCGAGNWFGHPAPAAIRRAEETGADLFRTDLDGAVRVSTDGRRVAVATMTGKVWRRRAG